MADEDKKDFQQLQLARWKASGQDINTYLQKSGLGDKGYIYDQNTGKFDHPDSYLSTVDPNTVPSIADRNAARAAQGLDAIANNTATPPPNAGSSQFISRPDDINKARNAQGFAVGDVDPSTGQKIVAITTPNRQPTGIDPNTGRPFLPVAQTQEPQAIRARAFRDYGTGLTPDAEWNRNFPTSTSSVQPIDFRPVVNAVKQTQADVNAFYDPYRNRFGEVDRYSTPPPAQPVVRPSARPSGYVEPPVSQSQRDYWLNQALQGNLALPRDRGAVRAAARSPYEDVRNSIWLRRPQY